MRIQLIMALLIACAAAQAESPRGQQELKGELDGIPMHYISVQTRPHEDVEIQLDGIVDEAIWQEVPWFDNMLVSVPATGDPGEYKTENRLLATEKGLYISSIMYQPPDTVVHRMTKRDQQSDRDSFGVTIDPTGDGTYAFWFSLSPGDVVMDGKVLPERRYSSDWDGPWLYKSAINDDGWSVEIFYPWSMMSLPEQSGTRQVGFALSRTVSFKNERYYWPGHTYTSPQFVTALNTMHLEGVEPRQSFSFIPYISDELDNARDENELNVGADITWKPSSRLELTASLNPDFGAVEADNVVLNLTAFETFFPEKRLFFLEGNEIFVTTPRANSGNALREVTNENFATTSRRVFVSDFVQPPISLLNTRRIGGTATQVTLEPGVVPKRGETGLPTDLLGAIKTTGQSGDLRYGILAAFEDDVEWLGIDLGGNEVDIEDEGRDFAVARVSYERSERNRYAIGYLGTFTQGSIYNASVHGLDAHFGTSDGRWSTDLQLMHSDVNNITGQGALIDVTYAPSSRFQHKVELDYFDEEVEINDLGFLRRNDYGGLQYIFRYAHAAPDAYLKAFRGAVTVRQQYNISKGQVVDSGIYWRNRIEIPGRNTFQTALAYLPERYEDIDSRGHGAYKAEDRVWWNILWTTDASKMLTWSFSIGGLQEDLGDWTQQYSMGVTARPTPNLEMKLDVKYKRRDGWLVYQGRNNFGAYDAIDWQPSLEASWFLAPRHQLRFSLQWAGVRADEQGFYAVPGGDGELIPANPTLPDHDFTVSLLTAQLRYRWEIAPLTDLFVVYNRGNRLAPRQEDSFSDLFSDTLDDPQVDSLVVKLRYRFGH
ncbi:MAG: hypothetical protein JJ934_09145 [Pseudomonadales bacterium]|nr:hypothetical protein [Pseudomonadales bacterium]